MVGALQLKSMLQCPFTKKTCRQKKAYQVSGPKNEEKGT